MKEVKGVSYKILFVCLGNICRSPTAESVMQYIVDKNGFGGKIFIDSAGISSMHQGERADRRAISYASERGYKITSISRPVTRSDFYDFDLIVGMDSQNIADLSRISPDSELMQKVVPMSKFFSEHTLDYVPDPYYGGEAGFKLVVDLLEDGCKGILAHISSKI